MLALATRDSASSRPCLLRAPLRPCTMSESKKSPKFLKAGKIVLLLNGRMAGKKGIIVKTLDEGTPNRPYGHAVVAGIQKYPLKITKTMSEKKITKRSRVRAALPPPPRLPLR